MSLTFGPSDCHMVVSHAWHSLNVFDGHGKLLFHSSALTSGTGGSVDNTGGDTPFGDYLVTSEIIETLPAEPWDTRAAYGPWFLGLTDLEGQESSRGRAGIGMHGGRQGDYAPDPTERHLLYPTHGCIRVFDDVLSHKIVPLVRSTQAAGGRVVITVGP